MLQVYHPCYPKSRLGLAETGSARHDSAWHEILRHFNKATLDEFLNKWNSTGKKTALIEELLQQGILVEALYNAVNKELDLFDLICHVAYDQPPLTRKERANNVKKRKYFTRYGEQTRKVLENLLDNNLYQTYFLATYLLVTYFLVRWFSITTQYAFSNNYGWIKQ